MTAPVKSPWCTLAETAVYSRKSEHAVWQALQSGELQGNQSKKGGKWLIHIEAIDAWVRGEIADVKPPAATRRRVS